MTQSSRGTVSTAPTDSAPSALTPSDDPALPISSAAAASLATEPDPVAAMSNANSLPGETRELQAEPGATASGREQKPSRLRRTLQWVSTHRRESAAAVLVLIMLGIFADGQSEKAGSTDADHPEELREVEELLADFGTETKAFDTPEPAASSRSDISAADSSSLTIPITSGAGVQESGPTTGSAAYGSDPGSYSGLTSSEPVVTDEQGTLNISTADYAAGTGNSSSQVPAEQQPIATATSVDGSPSSSVPPGIPSAPRNRVSQIRFRGEIRTIRQ